MSENCMRKIGGGDMVVSKKVANILHISEIANLDPITIFLEDIEGRCSNAGKVTITCFDKAWVAYFGSIGQRKVAEFIASCDTEYLVNSFSRGIKRHVIDYSKISNDLGVEIDEFELYDYSEELAREYGDDWHSSLPEKINPNYTYLSRIIEKSVVAIRGEQGQ